MAQLFDRTLRSLKADGAGRSLAWLAAAALLLAAWCGWFFFARLAVYAVSAEARLEVESAAYPVDAPVSARLAAVHVTLGQEVAGGDVLFELEPSSLRARLEEEGQRLTALAQRREALEAERTSTVARQELAADTREAGVAEAQARHREARAAARQADAELARCEELHAAGLTSEAELERARSEAAQRWAATEALEVAVRRRRAEYRSGDRTLEAQLEKLRQELSRVDEEIAAARAWAADLRQQIADRIVRAPVSGRIGQLAELNPGSMVAAGQRLATVVPPGKARGVAWFPPAEALGRIRPGQPARLRLTGFPSTQYGSLRATVASVGGEVAAGRLRVELELTAGAGPIPLDHGLPGTAEVEVERVSPATLLLRVAGRAVTDRPPPGPARSPDEDPR